MKLISIIKLLSNCRTRNDIMFLKESGHIEQFTGIEDCVCPIVTFCRQSRISRKEMNNIQGNRKYRCCE